MRQSRSFVLPETGPVTAPATGARRSARPRPLVERIAGWSTRHRAIAIGGWLLLVAAAFAGGQAAGSSSVSSYDPGQAGQAEQTMTRLGLDGPPPAEQVLIEPKAAGATWASDPAMRQATAAIVAALHQLPAATASAIRSPLRPGGRSLVTASGHAALVTFNVTGTDEDTAVVPAEQAISRLQARWPGVTIAEAGDASVDRIASADLSSEFRQAEQTTLPVTLVLLLAVFGALIAAGIPLLLAGTSVLSAISLSAVIGRWLPVGQATSEVILIIGMAVGVDYTLFYLRREREERARGATTAEALRIAAGTSGRAIVVSGLTVMIALAGLFLTGWSVFTGIAIGTIAVVGASVLGSLTVLPALLSLLGPWADRGRIPFLGRRRTGARPSRLWAALVRRVVAHPVAWGGAAAVALLALAAPAAGMHLGNPPDGGFTGRQQVVATQAAISRAFPAVTSPALVIITGPDLDGPQARTAIAALERAGSASGPLGRPVTAQLVADGRAWLGSVPLPGDGSDGRSLAALRYLRQEVLPATIGKVAGLRSAVTGVTAQNADDVASLDARTPLVLAVVAVLAFGLLLVAFRSLAIPLVSVGLNLLSVGAAYGLLALIFGGDRLEGLLGYAGYGAIVPWVPLFLFVFLFGLSMDYHVFILSRIRELRDAGRPGHEAIEGGIAGSAGVVTSAALIMVAVFSILAALSFDQLKMLGVGLAVAVLVDATVVRGILVPAALALLGERAWTVPGWLGRVLPAGHLAGQAADELKRT